jgi:hypothetical protein
MTDTLPASTVAEPGVHPDMDEATYHADPVPGGSLSSGGARLLLEPGGPAKFAYRRGKEFHSPTFDLGKAAHTMALGVGASIAVVNAKDWKTKAAQQARDQAHEDGATPLLVADYQRVLAMADAVKAHPLAGGLLAAGHPELSMFWVDKPTGVWCRSRPDWKTTDRHGRLLLVDLKTCEKADTDSIAKSVANYGYDQQAAWYSNGAINLDLAEDDEDMAFLFVFVEKSPPHLVHVVQLDADAMLRGRRRNRRALELYAQHDAAGVWPGHPTDAITDITLPFWATREDY